MPKRDFKYSSNKKDVCFLTLNPNKGQLNSDQKWFFDNLTHIKQSQEIKRNESFNKTANQNLIYKMEQAGLDRRGCKSQSIDNKYRSFNYNRNLINK